MTENMNRPGLGPQTLRSLPNGFSNQQQISQSRSTPSRLPNGKMASNASTWGFGGVPMAAAGMQTQRPNNGPMTSFAQTIGSSQPATPLDLSEFPSLSNNPPQQTSNSAQPTWGVSSTRPVGQATNQRPQQSVMQTQQVQPQPQHQTQQQQQQQQDDLFSSSSQMANTQGSFRFGGQNPVTQNPQSGSTSDDFPPLSRNINGEIGQDRNLGLLHNVGFGSSSSSSMAFSGSTSMGQASRNNGLLNALSDSSRTAPSSIRTTVTASPGSINLATSRSPANAGNQIPAASRENETNGFGRSTLPDASNVSPLAQQQSPPLRSGFRSLGGSNQQQHSNGFQFDNSQALAEDPGPDVEDPLAGMNDKDRYGLKGLLSMLKGPYQDQAALVAGVDINTLGFDLNSSERLSDSIWSPWDDASARSDIPQYLLPDCYQVQNVAAVENKLSNFSDETLMFMFYSNPQDVQQIVAAQELANRNWRYHKKLQLWLTKDDMMVPQQVGAGTERGYYVFFDPKQWIRERREFLLNYIDLEPVPNGPPGPLS